MEQENFIQFIKELMEVNTLHQEYQDNDIHCVIDSAKDKDGNLTIKVKLIEDKDKKDFEAWLQNIDDELFSEVIDDLKEKHDIDNLNDLYNNSDQYKEVIKLFKEAAKKIALRKIEAYKKLF